MSWYVAAALVGLVVGGVVWFLYDTYSRAVRDGLL